MEGQAGDKEHVGWGCFDLGSTFNLCVFISMELVRGRDNEEVRGWD